MTDDQLFEYGKHKEEFSNPSKRTPKGFTEAIEAIEDAIKNEPVKIISNCTVITLVNGRPYP